MLQHWALDPAVTYLNHGTVGAPPRRALEAQQKLRDQIERQPSRFLLRELTGPRFVADNGGPSLLRIAADRVARFLGAEGRHLVFVDNATSGANAVLRSFDFREGDEIVLLDHAYGGVLKAAQFAARVRGATVREVEFPQSGITPDRVVQLIDEELRPRTRMVLIDHVTSRSALILPVAEIASRCHRRGIVVLVDGAHAPGAIPVDIPSLGVDWYTGNLHKWAWSPRSSGVLWTDPKHQPIVHPNVISWGLDTGMTEEFDWPGTRDPTPHLAAPDGISFMEELGVSNVQRYNHELAWNAGREMAAQWKTSLLAGEEMIGTMVTVPLPERFGSTPEDALRLRDTLLFEHNIEVHTHEFRGRLHVRVSAQVYNEMSDVEKLLRRST
jgi:isopenicillin-N epimerase